jgi:hypothetical protein
VEEKLNYIVLLYDGWGRLNAVKQQVGAGTKEEGKGPKEKMWFYFFAC